MQLTQLGKDLGENSKSRSHLLHRGGGRINLSQIQGLTDIGQALREVYESPSGPDLGAVIMMAMAYSIAAGPRIDAERLACRSTGSLGDTTVRPDLVLRGGG